MISPMGQHTALYDVWLLFFFWFFFHTAEKGACRVERLLSGALILCIITFSISHA